MGKRFRPITRGEKDAEERRRDAGRPMDEDAGQEPFVLEGVADMAHAFEEPPDGQDKGQELPQAKGDAEVGIGVAVTA